MNMIIIDSFLSSSALNEMFHYTLESHDATANKLFKAEVTFTSSFRSKSCRRTRIQMNVFVKKKIRQCFIQAWFFINL